MKQIVEYHISRLQDKNPDIRIKAITELVLLKDSDALTALEKVFKTDADETVRKAAQKAGRDIFLSNRAQDG